MKLESAIRKAQKAIRAGADEVLIERKCLYDRRYLPWGCMRTTGTLLTNRTNVIKTFLPITVGDFDAKYRVVTE